MFDSRAGCIFFHGTNAAHCVCLSLVAFAGVRNDLSIRVDESPAELPGLILVDFELRCDGISSFG